MIVVVSVKLVSRSQGKLAFWIGLLALVEMGDAVTTGAGMAHGDVEANQLVAALLAWGGLAALFLLKGSLVLVLGSAAALAQRCAKRHPGRLAAVARAVAWRGTQLCVVLLGLVVLHNLYLLSPLGS